MALPFSGRTTERMRVFLLLGSQLFLFEASASPGAWAALISCASTQRGLGAEEQPQPRAPAADRGMPQLPTPWHRRSQRSSCLAPASHLDLTRGGGLREKRRDVVGVELPPGQAHSG